MRNVIILKNLPSNIIDEAIVVVKDKKKIQDINYDGAKHKKENNIIQGSMKSEDLKKLEETKKESRKYVIKEAEVVVTNYIKRIEENTLDKKVEKLRKSYKVSKMLNVFLALTTLVGILISV